MIFLEIVEILRADVRRHSTAEVRLIMQTCVSKDGELPQQLAGQLRAFVNVGGGHRRFAGAYSERRGEEYRMRGEERREEKRREEKRREEGYRGRGEEYRRRGKEYRRRGEEYRRRGEERRGEEIGREERRRNRSQSEYECLVWSSQLTKQHSSVLWGIAFALRRDRGKDRQNRSRQCVLCAKDDVD